MGWACPAKRGMDELSANPDDFLIRPLLFKNCCKVSLQVLLFLKTEVNWRA
jgi:hypothetical protein